MILTRYTFKECWLRVTGHGTVEQFPKLGLYNVSTSHICTLQQVRRTSMFSGNGVTKLIISICYSPKFTNQKFLLIPNIFHEFF